MYVDNFHLGKIKEFLSLRKDCSGATESLQIIPRASRLMPMEKKMVTAKKLAFCNIQKYRDATMIEIDILSALSKHDKSIS